MCSTPFARRVETLSCLGEGECENCYILSNKQTSLHHLHSFCAAVAMCPPNNHVVTSTVCSSAHAQSCRPDTTRVWNFADHFRQPVSAPGGGAGGEDWLALPQYFKHNGYLTLGSGKLYHPGVPPDNDCPLSWTSPSLNPAFDYFCTSKPTG